MVRVRVEVRVMVRVRIKVRVRIRVRVWVIFLRVVSVVEMIRKINFTLHFFNNEIHSFLISIFWL